ncbi:hypothetical protein Patl1_04298 [Pistacia atlantica]|uniref:Uncharacterized protein n=1 Tax=Pistacia atlantica TaxID=434234 RepID=A0ACC1BW90_9ROSI|nr:hypothetical protein Patl1_04298 [Pistacia atlantica]
MNSTALFHHL